MPTVHGYFMPSGWGIAFIVRSYEHLSVVVSWNFFTHGPIEYEWF